MEELTKAQRELYEWLAEYIRSNQHAPSIRQMMRAMNLKSPAPIQSRLERLQTKGYIDWTKGKARTLRILHPDGQGLPIRGAIAAGQLVEPYADVQERLDFSALVQEPNCFALRVTGNSMIGEMIRDGDVAILRQPADPNIATLKNGEIVAAHVPGEGTTLKRFYRHADVVKLEPANPDFNTIEVAADQVEVQGILIGVWRPLGR
ncbi:MAG: repressor LexA [Spirulinaceae cyanobacterium SM2_1_0]|nr:repressor LexA [Spirulinaceae cyanobacterium SM2_1_0]